MGKLLALIIYDANCKKGIIETANFIGLAELVMNLIASLMIGYGRIFRFKKTIKKESRNDTPENVHEEKYRLIETRFAQIGAASLSLDFATPIWGLVIEG